MSIEGRSDLTSGMSKTELKFFVNLYAVGICAGGLVNPEGMQAFNEARERLDEEREDRDEPPRPPRPNIPIGRVALNGGY